VTDSECQALQLSSCGIFLKYHQLGQEETNTLKVFILRGLFFCIGIGWNTVLLQVKTFLIHFKFVLIRWTIKAWLKMFLRT